MQISVLDNLVAEIRKRADELEDTVYYGGHEENREKVEKLRELLEILDA